MVGNPPILRCPDDFGLIGLNSNSKQMLTVDPARQLCLVVCLNDGTHADEPNATVKTHL
jgi:hypothetical protein